MFISFLPSSGSACRFSNGMPISGGNRDTGPYRSPVSLSDLDQNLNSVDRNRSVCHFQGSIGLTGGLGSTESGIFGQPMGYRSADSCVGPVDRWIWFHRIRDFRSTGGIFGLSILVWVALPCLFSNVVFMMGLGAYCALAHDFIKCFQRDF